SKNTAILNAPLRSRPCSIKIRLTGWFKSPLTDFLQIVHDTFPNTCGAQYWNDQTGAVSLSTSKPASGARQKPGYSSSIASRIHGVERLRFKTLRTSVFNIINCRQGNDFQTALSTEVVTR